MTTSGYDCWKRKGLSWLRKLGNARAETTFSSSPLQIRGPETLKVRTVGTLASPGNWSWHHLMSQCLITRLPACVEFIYVQEWKVISKYAQDNNNNYYSSTAVGGNQKPRT